MNVPLSPEAQEIIARMLASGQYDSANEVVSDALRFMEHNPEAVREIKRRRLLALIEEGEASLREGRGIVLEDKAAISRFFKSLIQ